MKKVPKELIDICYKCYSMGYEDKESNFEKKPIHIFENEVNAGFKPIQRIK